ncbi:MAG: outer membrane lipoprotein chaperone LolA [Pseudomonadota bacterium]
MIKLYGTIVLAALALNAQAQTATPVNAPTAASAEEYALNQLVELLQQTTTLDAAVEQLEMDQDGRELKETRAKLVMQKPASFRWEITEPYSELTVADGKTIWHYEPDLEQVTIQVFDTELDRTPVMLLNGTTESIGNSYAVSATTMDDGTHQRFILVPKQPDSLFERMSLTFNGPVLEEMQFEDSLGQQTSLSFKDVQRNQSLDAALFQYTPPTGVDVIDSTQD